ncbi:Predicted acyltransferase [Chitinophaga sp. CF118]|nr:Predicted acyltransferase [Chitinophaga sp. CF118]
MKLSQRLLSIDAFRAITMLTMIFVNDVSGVSNIPAWIEHVKANEDGLGFADTVFPAFLFIVGLSIPIAIGRRISRQESFWGTEWHIIVRSVALIVMGFFHVNLESYNNEAALLPHAVWEILITIGFFLIWLDYPETINRTRKYLLMGTGVLLLLLMAILYKGGSTPENSHWMRPSWWGILGIIGWAYLVCATLFLLVKGRFPALVAILAAFLLINITNHGGWFTTKLWLIGDGSSVSLIMAGAVVSSLYIKLMKDDKRNTQLLTFALLGIGGIAAGIILRPYTDGISKIRSTPAWVLICSGISILVFNVTIWLVDVKGKMNWFNRIRPAGTSTLTCYLIPYLLYSIFELVHFHFPTFLSEGFGGIIRSIAVAFAVILIVGWMEKKKVRLKI